MGGAASAVPAHRHVRTGRADFELPPPAEEIPPQAALPLAVQTAGEEHVRELIESTLRERIGDVPLWDEDGDLALRVAGMVVFVGVGPHERTVDVFAPIVHQITDVPAPPRSSRTSIGGGRT